MAPKRTVKSGRPEPRLVLLAAGIVALAGLLYLPTLNYGFVSDDMTLIVQNQDLQASTPFGFFGQSYTHWRSTQGLSPHAYYRPLVISSFWLDLRLWSMRPFGFHLTNVLLNCAVGVLVVLVLVGMLASFWPALLGGLAFVLHSAHVESVAFVSGRTDLMMALFFLLAFLALLRFRRRPTGMQLGLTLVPFAAALLCKETALLFPALAVFVLLPELRRPAQRGRAWLLVGTMGAIVVAYLVARAAVLTGPAPGWGEAGPGLRFMLAVNSFGRYAFMSLFPFDRGVFFLDPVALGAFGWPTIVAAVALAAAVWAAVRYRSTPVGIGSLWFLLTILPACDLLPPGRSFLSQRMLYLPTVGTVLAIAAFAVSVRRWRKALAVLALLYSGAMGWFAASSMPVWRSQLSLSKAMVAQFPNDVTARFELAHDLQVAGDWQGAARELRRCLELAPSDTAAWGNLGDVLIQQNDLAGAAEAYRRTLALDPNSALAHNSLGVTLLKSGDLAGAEAAYRAALKLQPDLVMARSNLGQVLVLRDRPDSALVELGRALQARPGDVTARFSLGVALQALGRTEEARVVFRQVLNQDPRFPGAAERLRVLSAQGLR
ncbi:tetratricopeptide repeat protein [candidate division WOR-3 bacterium]|nr:tetratricopeptide repeat protein [candidate division WOR-3 bacterium]